MNAYSATIVKLFCSERVPKSMLPVSMKKFEALLKNFKKENNCVVVGLTGGIASGKSTVSDMLEKLGAPLIDFDLIARQVVEPGTHGLEAIANYFGKQILTEDGTLDRKKLSEIVFQDFEKRKKLESFIHPPIYEEFFKQIGAIATKDPDAVIQVSIPLLIELNMQNAFDNLIIVYVSQKTQVERLVQRDGISIKEATNILKSQLPIDEKVGFANFVINNENSVEETKKQVDKVWRELKKIQK
ncbi:MAG: dephospho-CoA kinase [Deltaproteobacteria bacterium]|nr:dephospho-CoA kinase [Deltaproteobacteria bacterium]